MGEIKLRIDSSEYHSHFNNCLCQYSATIIREEWWSKRYVWDLKELISSYILMTASSFIALIHCFRSIDFCQIKRLLTGYFVFYHFSSYDIISWIGICTQCSGYVYVLNISVYICSQWLFQGCNTFIKYPILNNICSYILSGQGRVSSILAIPTRQPMSRKYRASQFEQTIKV